MRRSPRFAAATVPLLSAAECLGRNRSLFGITPFAPNRLPMLRRFQKVTSDLTRHLVTKVRTMHSKTGQNNNQ
jgi:hypothetical protein